MTRLGELSGGFAVLLPEPQDELRALQHAVWERLPEWPPYGGEVADPEPHATVGHDADLQEVAAAVEPLLPVQLVVDAVALLEGSSRVAGAGGRCCRCPVCHVLC